jgi:hypothetical protein
MEYINPFEEKPMNIKTICIVAAAAFALLLCLAPTRHDSAVVFAGENTVMPCTLQTVAGTYGFDGQGFLGIGTPQAVQAAETGVATADGAGNLAGTVTFSINGNILRTPFTGTYNVNADCTISEVVSFGTQTRHQEGIVVLDGREIDFIQTDPGSVLTRVAKRVTLQP